MQRLTRNRDRILQQVAHTLIELERMPDAAHAFMAIHSDATVSVNMSDCTREQADAICSILGVEPSKRFDINMGHYHYRCTDQLDVEWTITRIRPTSIIVDGIEQEL